MSVNFGAYVCAAVSAFPRDSSMSHRVPGYRIFVRICCIALVVATSAPLLAAAAPEARELAANPPADGMLLFLTPAAGGQPPNTLHRVYPNDTGLAPVDLGVALDVRRALISPDGSRFALYAVTSGNVGRIYLANADGSGLTALALDATHLGLEDWHPSGNELLVWRFENDQYDLARLSLDGILTALTDTPGADERGGRWTPSGTAFSFTSSGVGGVNDVFVQQLNGVPTNITNSPEDEGPAEWAPGGTRIVYAQGESLIAADPSGANTFPLDAGAEILSYGWSPTGQIYASDVDGDVASTPDDGTGLQNRLSLEENSWVADWGRAHTLPLALIPENINISVIQGAPDPAPVSVLIQSEDFVTPWSATTGASWLDVNPDEGTTPETIELSFETSSLDAGLYAAPVTFLPGPRTLNVTVAVNPPGTQTELQVAPDALSFFGTVGEDNPGAASISVSSTGLPLNWVASENAPWLTLAPSSGITPASIVASVDTAGMSEGRYDTVVTVEPGNHQVNVSLELFAPDVASELVVTPQTLSFAATEGGDAPPGQQLSINHTGDDEIAWSAVTSASWLGLSSYSGVTPAIVDVVVDPAGLPAGVYTGTVWIGQATVAVTLQVGDNPNPPPPPPAGDVSISVSELALASIENGALPGVKEITITSATGAPVGWTAAASEPWVLLSASSGTTPETLKVRANVEGLAPGTYSATVAIGSHTIPVTLHVIDGVQPDPAFQATWARQDLPVDEGAINRTWLWGPTDNGTTTEPYAEAPDGNRHVSYYDKSRMEITHPDDDRNAVWYVTNGLLAWELITGQLQLGDTLFVPGDPSAIPIAGDADDSTGPRYVSFQPLLTAPPLANGSIVTQTIDATGAVGADARLAGYGVTAGNLDPETGHTVASVFWDYLHEDGLVWDDGGYVQGPLFDPWFFATGLPITEPYWARVKVAEVVQDVLIQCFERRCLTYTPNNPAGWEVEQANVGMHYFRWRYERPA